MKPILILDFDGVIVDSTEECAVVAWNAWLKYNHQPGSVRLPEQIPDSPLNKLRYLRNYVKTAGEYLVIFNSDKNGVDVDSQTDYDKIVADAGKDISDFASYVFSERETLRQNEHNHWVNLHTIYSGVGNQLKKIWDHFDVYVVTGKDKETVLTFYKALNLPLKKEHVFDKDAGKQKLQIIRDLAGEKGVPLSKVVFVDDNVMHLLPLKNAGCRVLMAEWGYHTDEHLVIAKSNGMRLIKIPEMAEAIMQAL